METTKTKKKASGKGSQQVAVKKAPARKTAAGSTGTQRRSRRTEDIPERRRVYGRSKPKKRSGLQTLVLAAQATAQENAAKRAAIAARKERVRQATPAVIYTQPQAFNRNRFLIQIITVLAIVLALVLGMSVFFKVETVTVSGAQVYTIKSVEEASGIKKGDSLFGFSRARAAALITANLPYVKNVSFGIKLPDTVNIIVEEEDVVYSIQDQNGQWWLINSEGRVVQQIKDAAASNYTQVLGVAIRNPVSGRTAVASERSDDVQEEAGGDGSQETEEIPVGNSAAQRLESVLEILTALEDNDVVGSAASVNVTDMAEIELWYGTRYQVQLGDSSRLREKIDYMTDAIAQLSDYQSGILDISFRIWSNQVIVTPFSS